MTIYYSKIARIPHLILCLLYITLLLLTFDETKAVSNTLWIIISVFYLGVYIHKEIKGYLYIDGDSMTKYETYFRKKIKICEITQVKKDGSVYTLISKTKKITIDLTYVSDKSMEEIEGLLKAIHTKHHPAYC